MHALLSNQASEIYHGQFFIFNVEKRRVPVIRHDFRLRLQLRISNVLTVTVHCGKATKNCGQSGTQSGPAAFGSLHTNIGDFPITAAVSDADKEKASVEKGKKDAQKKEKWQVVI